jgi:phosphohistidine phosphatase
MIRVYFLRHGIAQPSDVVKLPDEERALTELGVQRTRQIAKLLSNSGVEPSHLLTSPLVRARQTADIIGQELEVAVHVRDEIGPGFNLPALDALLTDLPDDAEVMVVGHEPDFSSTISALIGGGSVIMKKGGLARVDVVSRHPLRGTLVWLIAPKVYERLS